MIPLLIQRVISIIMIAGGIALVVHILLKQRREEEI
jgi:Trk-type K+ transport system membrane component